VVFGKLISILKTKKKLVMLSIFVFFFQVTELRKRFPELNIQVDGGVSVQTIDKCAKAGANIVVSGSGMIAIFFTK
jgi:pentose-5-phosphate-3-epimerase